jgi:2,3-bisphosphoglycerate-independent phosphoglycerate mutase
MSELKKTTLLIILDGWGVTHNSHSVSAITPETAPHYFSWLKKFPHTELAASGVEVGLFDGQEGNSEAGHLNLGAGRVVKQDALYISEAITDGSFFKNTAFLQAAHHLKKYGTRAHVIGLMSNHNSAHSCPEHLYALLDLLAKEKIERVYLHLFTDGRDSGEHDALHHLKKLQEHFHGDEKVATVMGRFYGMDRNKVWERTERAYHTIVNGKGSHATHSAEEAIAQAYNRGETDEFISPTVITDSTGAPLATVTNNDVIFFFNLRSDRARQLTKSLVQDDFNHLNPGGFERGKLPKHLRFVAMADFGPDLDGVLTAFPSRDVVNSLVKVLGSRPQLYVGESEKFAHITYFLNGGYADHDPNTIWLKIPSDHIEHFAKKPAMQAAKIANAIIENMSSGKFEFIAANFANADMVGHTGDLSAAERAVRLLDKELGRVVESAVAAGAVVVVTADHGNAEDMINIETGEVDTEHSVNSVPFFLIASATQLRSWKIGKNKKLPLGKLADVAPTILKIMNLSSPKEMTGKSLF